LILACGVLLFLAVQKISLPPFVKNNQEILNYYRHSMPLTDSMAIFVTILKFAKLQKKSVQYKMRECLELAQPDSLYKTFEKIPVSRLKCARVMKISQTGGD